MKFSLKNGFLTQVVKIFVLFLTLVFLYKAFVTTRQQLADLPDHFSQLFRYSNLFKILSVVFLIPLNWGFEALKWKHLSKKFEQVSFLRAYRSVMAGLTLGFITPNRIGDYAGRILELKSSDRLDAIGAVFLGRFCQMVVTVVFGCLSFIYFLPYFIDAEMKLIYWLFFVLLVTTAVVTVASLFLCRFLIGFLKSVTFLKKYVHYVAVIATYSSKEIANILFLSVLRYCVFCLQFLLLLHVFGVELSWWQYLPGIAVTFLLKSLVPTLNFVSEVGMRELASMHFFSLLHQNVLLVMGASLSLWVLNLAVPSAVGLLFVLRLKFFRK